MASLGHINQSGLLIGRFKLLDKGLRLGNRIFHILDQTIHVGSNLAEFLLQRTDGLGVQVMFQEQHLILECLQGRSRLGLWSVYTDN